MDAERATMVAGMVVAARAVWAERQDGAVLQEFLKGRGCNGVDAGLVTMEAVGCGLAEAQAMFFAAPCRAAERDFHNAAVEGLERSRDGA
ncbi:MULTISPECIES: hypothetical protein [unclassified Streptomyces]|uniref:hypothetical protein n=1 Tax=unclassified Streptomyces TaxID=2593676 RepID=UPI002E15FB66|nr:hypothetical protein OG457_29595 [Streptomyces sp. NBC_01207]WTA20760.1 hypothetical protein OG365_23480 [Streptomyces sp. NBC_00853]